MTENRYHDLGKKLLNLRKIKFGDMGIKKIAPKLGIKYSYLNKLENGLQKPSLSLLNNIKDVYKLSSDEVNDLISVSGLGGGVIEVNEVKNPEPKYETPKEGKGINLTLNPQQTPVLYADNINITATNYGFVIDFSQRVGNSPNYTVVARLGMSEQHVQVFVERLGAILNKRKLVVKSGTLNKVVS